MSIHTVGGKTSQFDYRERIAAATIGGEHVVPRSQTAHSVAAIVDDADPAITYGTYGGSFGSFTSFASEGYTHRGTQTIIGSTSDIQYSAASMNFNGSSMGVMGGTNPYSGIMRVYIDGVAASGRLPLSINLNISLITNSSQPVVSATDMTITTLTIPAGFAASGTILLGNELITYSSKTGTDFIVSARGAGGTTAQAHYASETVYAWGAAIDLGTTTAYTNKRLLWYNPFLSPGLHTIMIVVETGFTTYSRIYFDGFITGSLVGASNLFTQTGTITCAVSTDGNGHSDVGGIVANNSDVSIIGILGFTQTNCETTNAIVMAKLGVRYQPDGSPYFYVHNGPLSSSITLLITFMFIGETL